jgi:hypothetical protein
MNIPSASNASQIIATCNRLIETTAALKLQCNELDLRFFDGSVQVVKNLNVAIRTVLLQIKAVYHLFFIV